MEILEEAVRLRRHLHMYPELGFDVEHTAKFIDSYLSELGIRTERIAGTGVVAYIQGKNDANPVLALRSDMDACPIQEETGLDYKSQNHGVMHACGHDAHMAILLSLAKYLTQSKYVPEGNVKLIFQPAEEIGTGAKGLIAEGVLDDVDAIVGYHLWPHWDPGTIQVKDGVQMAGSDRFKINLTGKGGHGAYPSEALNPINGAAEICLGINMILSRVLKTLDYASLSIGKLESGTTFNVIPDTAIIEGSLRTLSSDTRETILREIANITDNIARVFRLKSAVYLEQIAPILNNDPIIIELVKTAIAAAGQQLVEISEPVMVSEDFAFYLERKPGVFFLLGARKEGTEAFLHNAKFDINEIAMQKAILTLAMVVKTYRQTK